jgi:hypothetical protein
MIRYLSFLLFILTFISCDSETQIKLADNGSSDFVIRLAQSSDNLTSQAAESLQKYLELISGSSIPIVSNSTSSEKEIIIGRSDILPSGILNKLSTLKEDGFLIKISTDKIYLCGNNGKADLYAVYTFLEEQLGCMRFSYNEEHIPKNPRIKLTSFEKYYDPSFSFRQPILYDKKDTDLIHWHKVENRDDWGMFVHTFQHLISPEEYFEQHPDFFALVNGKRIKDGQLCLSNHEMLQTLSSNLRSNIEKKPNKKFWSVSQNDCYNYCECSECEKKYDQYSSISGAYIELANTIAKEFPEKQISTLAYQFTRSAPKNIKPLGNVNVMFCSIECNRSMPFETDPRSADFVTDMKDWSKLSSNIFMWDYVVQFENYLCPFPNFHTLQPNIQFFKNHGVDMLFEQGSGYRWSDMKELKFYLLSKLCWDVNANIDSLSSRFFDIYYGKASLPIRKYYDITHQRMIEHQESEGLNIYGFPLSYVKSFLTPAYAREYVALMDEAETLAQEDSVLLKRVWRTRIPVDFAFLDLALNYNDSSLSFITEQDGEMIIDDQMITHLNRMVALGTKTDVFWVNEKRLTLIDYREYLLHNLNRKITDNLAKKASITLLTNSSEKYKVGKEASLTDGLMGGLNFNYNWLGFEGEDMVAVLDFTKSTVINRITMNYLKALVSWIFLPEKITIEGSVDGNNYTRLAEQIGNVENRNFRVESVPFIFEIPDTEIRYLKITAKSLKSCPDWHRGYGQPSWIFIDELVIE